MAESRTIRFDAVDDEGNVYHISGHVRFERGRYLSGALVDQRNRSVQPRRLGNEVVFEVGYEEPIVTRSSEADAEFIKPHAADPRPED